MGNTISPELKVSASAFVCISSVGTGLQDEVFSILEGKSCATFKQGCIFLFARKMETARDADMRVYLMAFETLREIHQI